MGIRGRKSAASLAVLPVANMRQELQAPDHLSKIEAQLFREVLANAPANQFSFSDQYLLATFCQITILIRALAKDVTKATKESEAAKTKMLLDACKTQSMLATKLRLTTSARTAAHSVARDHAKHRPPSAYDLMRNGEGWENL